VSAGVKLGVLLTLDCSVQPAGGLLLTETFPQSPESIPKVALDRSNTRSLLGYCRPKDRSLSDTVTHRRYG